MPSAESCAEGSQCWVARWLRVTSSCRLYRRHTRLHLRANPSKPHGRQTVAGRARAVLGTYGWVVTELIVPTIVGWQTRQIIGYALALFSQPPTQMLRVSIAAGGERG